MSFRSTQGMRAALLVLACVCWPAAHLQAQPPPGPDGRGSQARIERKTYHFKEAKKDMEYALFVPAGYEKSKKAPLVVALHGYGSNPQQILRYRGLTDLAEERGYLLVAPMGYNEVGFYGSRVQVPGAIQRFDPPNLPELSEKDVMNVLEIVRKEYAVDPDRIYLLGHSMGGAGVMHLGVKYPHLWGGLAAIAPAINRPPGDAAKLRRVPVIMVAGDQDPNVPVAVVRRWVEQMKKLGMNYEYVEIAGGTHGSVAAQGMTKVFDFFDKNKRVAKEQAPVKP